MRFRPTLQIYASQGLDFWDQDWLTFTAILENRDLKRGNFRIARVKPVAGGFTRLNDVLPDANLRSTILPRYLVKEQNSKLSCWGDFNAHANGQHMTELSELAQSGVVRFADGQYR
jgi:dihydroorotase